MADDRVGKKTLSQALGFEPPTHCLRHVFLSFQFLK